MDKESLTRFLIALGADEEKIIYDEERRWIRCPCIFAPWTHKSGKDSSPSFGMTIRDDDSEGESVGNCKTCGSYWNSKEFWHVEEILHRFWRLSGEYPKAASYEYIFGRKSEEHQAINIRIRSDNEKEDTPCYPLPARVLKKYPKLQYGKGIIEAIDVMEYLLVHRNIPLWVQNYFGVRYNQDNRSMVFPLTCLDGKTYTMRERICDVSQKKIWTVNGKTSGFTDVLFSTTTRSGAMFGLAEFDKCKKMAVICEGEIDAMNLFSLGMSNTLAAATNQITTAQCKAIHPYIDRIIHFPDADKAGGVAVKKLNMFFHNTDVKIQVADCGIIKVADGFSSRKKNAKDPGDLENETQLQHIMSNLITPEEFLDKYKS